MKKTRFSLHTDIESKEVTFMCHFKLEGVMNTNTLHSFDFIELDDMSFQMEINNLDHFKTMCQVQGVAQKFVKEFILEAIRVASFRGWDVEIDHENNSWLRLPDTIERLETKHV
tara:strand:- start:292 stop:633 length:342 start_codon:yes stop_codon:yes gene_type:complete